MLLFCSLHTVKGYITGLPCLGATTQVTLRLKEQEDVENEIKHANPEDHAEFDFDLNDSHWDVWEAKYDKSGPASTPVLKSRADAGAAQVKAANTKPDTDVLYIRTVLWNTTTKLPTDPDGDGPRPASTLLGHNGKHQISLAQVNEQATSTFLFDKLLPTGQWKSAPYIATPTEHQVGNLVIESAKSADGNLDIVRYIPDSPDEALAAPKVQIVFSDADYQE